MKTPINYIYLCAFIEYKLPHNRCSELLYIENNTSQEILFILILIVDINNPVMKSLLICEYKLHHYEKDSMFS